MEMCFKSNKTSTMKMNSYCIYWSNFYITFKIFQGNLLYITFFTTKINNEKLKNYLNIF